MKLIIAAGLGSFIGGITRYLATLFTHHKNSAGFPVSTLVINLTGCFLIGLLYAIFEKNNMEETWRVFFISGILGGFTTFSAFSMETILLFKNGQSMMAVIYIAASLVAGLSFTLIAYRIAT
jgi:fluoride exporter